MPREAPVTSAIWSLSGFLFFMITHDLANGVSPAVAA
jgi:hypothetical protein